MNKRFIFLVLSVFLGLLLIGSIIASPRVAYIHRSKGKIDMNVLNIFNESGLIVDYFIENDLPSDLSEYRFLFVGDEYFNSKLPINDYSVIIFSYNQAEKAGLVPLSGVGKLGSREPLSVNINGSDVLVYTQAKDNNGVSIPYYYLNNNNIPDAVKKVAGTYTTSSGPDFGYVIANANKGAKLLNSKESGGDICFFGITKTDYWTDESFDLFRDCVEFVNKPLASEIECNNDLDCGISGLSGDSFCRKNDLVQKSVKYICNNPGTENSFCTNKSSEKVSLCDLCEKGSCVDLVCMNDNECLDDDNSTKDICENPGTKDSKCVYTIEGKIEIVSFVTTPYETSVKLDFSANLLDNKSIIKGYSVKKLEDEWIELFENSYLYSGLIPNTEYTFYVKAIDNLNKSSDVSSVVIKTLAPVLVPEPVVIYSGGGGGGSSSSYGSMSWCSLEWVCSDWSNCVDRTKNRICEMPEDKCTPEKKKPIEVQGCIPEPEFEQLSAPVSSMEYENNGKEFDEIVPEVPTQDIGKDDGIVITGSAIAANVGKFSWIWVPILIVGIVLTYYYLSGGRVRKIKKK